MNTVAIFTLLGGFLLLFLPTRDRRRERRNFWLSTSILMVSGFFVAYPPDWSSGLWLAGMIGFAMVLRAYATTPYIKIRGKIYAFGLRDSQPDPGDEETASSPDSDYDPAPDSYSGIATAAKTWWLIIAAMSFCSGMIYLSLSSNGDIWYAVGAAVVLVLAALGFGLGDASWAYPIARGQKLQLVVAGLVTLGIFTALYLVGYAVGKRWPVRSQRSLEYRAHPHLQKMFPSEISDASEIPVQRPLGRRHRISREENDY